MSDPNRTRATLLARLADPGQAGQAAWTEFVDVYGGMVVRWCRRWGLQEADAGDVTQQVLLKLAGRMSGFAYDPGRSFRAWLKTVTRHALLDFEADRRRGAAGTGDSGVYRALMAVEARADLERRIEDGYDRELLEEAMRRARARVAPHTWEAFRLTAVDGMPAAEVAARLSMRVGTVYEARRSVTAKVREERERLEAEQDGRPPGAAP